MTAPFVVMTYADLNVAPYRHRFSRIHIASSPAFRENAPESRDSSLSQGGDFPRRASASFDAGEFPLKEGKPGTDFIHRLQYSYGQGRRK